MNKSSGPTVAIVDYGVGNLYSIRQAAKSAGLSSAIVREPEGLLPADGVILPGVGGFGDAVAKLQATGFDDALRSFIATGKPLLGICLGMQVLMSESEEFGVHKGLGIIPGKVIRFPESPQGESVLKVPHIGWNRIWMAEGPETGGSVGQDLWNGTLLEGTTDGEYMYFVHSFLVRPDDPSVALCATRYGSTQFCSGLKVDNISAFQFHPERSGPGGLKIFKKFSENFQSPGH